MAKPEPEVSEHLHRDMDVTVERVKSFGRSSRHVQLRVLAHLRATLADQSTAIEIAVFALLFSLVGYFVKEGNGVDFQGMNWLVAGIIGVMLGALLVLVVLPMLAPQLLRNRRQQRAQVWLAAYEDEIQRRRSKTRK